MKISAAKLRSRYPKYQTNMKWKWPLKAKGLLETWIILNCRIMCAELCRFHIKKKTKLYRNLKYTQVSKLLLTQSVQNKTFTGKLLLTFPYCCRERERKTAEDVKNSQGVWLNICFGRPGEEGRCAAGPLTCIQRSPSVFTINLNGVGVIILSPNCPLPD